MAQLTARTYASWPALALCILVWTTGPAALQIRSHDSEAALAVFHERLDRYAALHRKLEGPLPPRVSGRSEWNALIARRYLATALRSARHLARQGDIITPEAARVFRDIIREGLATPEGAPLAEGFRTRAANPVPSPLVNEPYPGEVAQPVPEAIARLLPGLVEDVEYRTVNADLMLWDIHADIVVDVLPDAFLMLIPDS